MKILYSILLISLFFSCNNEPPKSNDVISKIEFIELIKSIHLIEAKYEVQKNKNNVTAKHQLRVEYDSIFNSYKLKVEDFEKSIKLLGNKYIQANGRDANITNNNAGSIRLTLLW